MSKSRKSASGLSALLKKLDTRAEAGLARVYLRGRAVSKSEAFLHLSVATGIVAIPLDEIERVDSTHSDDSTLVAVTVRSGDRIRPLTSVGPLGDWHDLLKGRPHRPMGLGNPTAIPSEICKFTYEDICTDTKGTDGKLADTICGIEHTDENCKAD